MALNDKNIHKFKFVLLFDNSSVIKLLEDKKDIFKILFNWERRKNFMVFLVEYKYIVK